MASLIFFKKTISESQRNRYTTCMNSNIKGVRLNWYMKTRRSILELWFSRIVLCIFYALSNKMTSMQVINLTFEYLKIEMIYPSSKLNWYISIGEKLCKDKIRRKNVVKHWLYGWWIKITIWIVKVTTNSMNSCFLYNENSWIKVYIKNKLACSLCLLNC